MTNYILLMNCDFNQFERNTLYSCRSSHISNFEMRSDNEKCIAILTNFNPTVINSLRKFLYTSFRNRELSYTTTNKVNGTSIIKIKSAQIPYDICIYYKAYPITC